MFEFHGWATIRFSYENRDIENEDELQDAAVEQIRRYVQQLGYSSVANPVRPPQMMPPPHSRFSGQPVSAAKANVVLSVSMMNGQVQLWAEGFKNHAATIGQELLDLYHFIARVAPGSYGLLYIYDDEHPDHHNEFRAYVLARGAFTEHDDPFLSPYIPTIEDSWLEE
jgi:immunity protein 7 of polymorphic toxin system